MKPNLFLAVVFAFVVAACGGGHDNATAVDDVAAVSEQLPDADRLCAIEALFHDLESPFREDPEDGRVVASEMRSLLGEMSATAPSDIRPSVEVLTVNFGLILDVYEAADFDMAAVDFRQLNELAEVDASGTPTPGAAEDADRAFEVWVSENCDVAGRSADIPTTTLGS